MTFSTTSKIDLASSDQSQLLYFERISQIKKIPIRGSFELLFRCNLKCVHCYLPKGYLKSADELSFEDICHIIDEICESGCIWLQFTGGEPLLRNDFLDIYKYAKSKGFLISIFTNGTLITQEIVDCLKEYPPYCVEVSLYSLIKKTYESITGTQESFERCLQGISMLVEAGISVKIKTVLMIANKNQIADIAKYAHRLGVEYKVFPIIIPTLDGSKDPCLLRVSTEDVTNLINIIDKNSDKHIFNLKYDSNTLKNEHLSSCGAGLNSFHIDALGNLTPCVILRTFTYDLRYGSFQDGWHKLVDYMNTFNLKYMKNDKYNNIQFYNNMQYNALYYNCPGCLYLEHKKNGLCRNTHEP